MQGGARNQNQVTAWLAVKMLAERPAALIVPRGKLSYLAAEFGEAVDDDRRLDRDLPLWRSCHCESVRILRVGLRNAAPALDPTRLSRIFSSRDSVEGSLLGFTSAPPECGGGRRGTLGAPA